MNKRISELRRHLNLTMEEFGKRLGVTRSAISNIESGKRNLTDQMLFAVCREFNVREEWIRFGTGDMFVPAPKDNLRALAEEYGLSSSDKLLLEKFISMKPDQRNIIKNFILETAKIMTENRNSFSAPDSEDDLDHMEPSNTTSHKVG